MNIDLNIVATGPTVSCRHFSQISRYMGLVYSPVLQLSKVVRPS
jgi:hypothetical protein